MSWAENFRIASNIAWQTTRAGDMLAFWDGIVLVSPFSILASSSPAIWQKALDVPAIPSQEEEQPVRHVVLTSQ